MEREMGERERKRIWRWAILMLKIRSLTTEPDGEMGGIADWV